MTWPIGSTVEDPKLHDSSLMIARDRDPLYDDDEIDDELHDEDPEDEDEEEEDLDEDDDELDEDDDDLEEDEEEEEDEL